VKLEFGLNLCSKFLPDETVSHPNRQTFSSKVRTEFALMNSVVVKREFGQERRKMTKIPGLVLKTENVICFTESNRMGEGSAEMRTRS
jgi:hypothetical protein